MKDSTLCLPREGVLCLFSGAPWQVQGSLYWAQWGNGFCGGCEERWDGALTPTLLSGSLIWKVACLPGNPCFRNPFQNAEDFPKRIIFHRLRFYSSKWPVLGFIGISWRASLWMVDHSGGVPTSTLPMFQGGLKTCNFQEMFLFILLCLYMTSVVHHWSLQMTYWWDFCYFDFICFGLGAIIVGAQEAALTLLRVKP